MRYNVLIISLFINVGCNLSKPDYEFVILNSDSAYVDWHPADYVSPSRLTKNELYELDKTIMKAVKTYPRDNLTILSTETLNKYRRQYVPYINTNNEKIVAIYGFCRILEGPYEISPGKYEIRPLDWGKNIIHPDDGGDCFWTFYVNLTTFENRLVVNGE